MTPKESLNRIKQYPSHRGSFYKQFTASDEEFDKDVANVEQALTELEELKRYPTSDEVCEELDKWYIDVTGDLLIATINDFTYDEDEKRFYKRMLHQPHQMTMCRLDTNDCVQLREPLPPHLITLIGRFYEGIEKK